MLKPRVSINKYFCFFLLVNMFPSSSGSYWRRGRTVLSVSEYLRYQSRYLAKVYPMDTSYSKKKISEPCLKAKKHFLGPRAIMKKQHTSLVTRKK